jgi:RNA polymerase subunit RPABC4/transcription elongation factor Spt4
MLDEHQQLCPYCNLEGRGIPSNNMYCPSCAIRLDKPTCPYCGSEGAYPIFDKHREDLFLLIVRGFEINSSVPIAAMHLLRMLYTAGIYNAHCESLEACVRTLDERMPSHSIKPLLLYLVKEYRDNSAEWFNKHPSS